MKDRVPSADTGVSWGDINKCKKWSIRTLNRDFYSLLSEHLVSWFFTRLLMSYTICECSCWTISVCLCLNVCMYDIVCLLSYVCDVCNYVLLVQLKKWRIYDYFRIRVLGCVLCSSLLTVWAPCGFQKRTLSKGTTLPPWGMTNSIPSSFPPLSLPIYSPFSARSPKNANCMFAFCFYTVSYIG